MMNKGLFCFSAILVVAIGCSSKGSQNDAAGISAGNAGASSQAAAGDEDSSSGTASVVPSAGGDGGTSPCGDDTDASFGGEAGNSADGDGDAKEACIAGSCRSTRAHVADAWGFTCPREFCDGRVLASDCSALPGGSIKTTSLDCWNRHVLLFEISPTRRKACYYAGAGLDEPVYLVGATVWDDAADFCDGRAKKISAGQTDELDSCDGDPFVNPLCDVAHPERNQGQEGTPPKACYNRFAHACTPCCEATLPDCSNEPDGYPGYECTADTPDDAAYCSCSCNHGQWQCLC